MVIVTDNCNKYQANQNEWSYNYEKKADFITKPLKKLFMADLAFTPTKNSKIIVFTIKRDEWSNANYITPSKIQFYNQINQASTLK